MNTTDIWLIAGLGNPFYEHYDEVLEILREYDVTNPSCGLYEPLRQIILAVRTDYGYLVKPC